MAEKARHKSVKKDHLLCSVSIHCSTVFTPTTVSIVGWGEGSHVIEPAGYTTGHLLSAPG